MAAMRYAAPVSRYMATPVRTALADDEVSDVHQRLVTEQISSLLVIGRDGRAAGVVSRRDLLRVGRVLSRGAGKPTLLELPRACVGDLMSHPVVAVGPDDPVGAAAQMMVDRGLHRVFVLEDGQPRGCFSTRDAMAVVREAKLTAPLDGFMTRRLLTVETTADLAQAVAALERSGVSGAVVTEGEAPVGLFTETEALEARELDRRTHVEEVMNPSLLCLPAHTPLHRAAGFALGTRARRIIAVEHHHPVGIVTGLDFTRALTDPPPEAAVAAG
jgi:CBS domain-containing protein